MNCVLFFSKELNYHNIRIRLLLKTKAPLLKMKLLHLYLLFVKTKSQGHLAATLKFQEYKLPVTNKQSWR